MPAPMAIACTLCSFLINNNKIAASMGINKRDNNILNAKLATCNIVPADQNDG